MTSEPRGIMTNVDKQMEALTGWGQDEDPQKFGDCGFDAHMVKPVAYMAGVKFLAESTASRAGVATSRLPK